MAIRGTTGRLLQEQGERKGEFTHAQKQVFLGFFAGSCNVKDAAARAEVATSTLYNHRLSDPAFRKAWAIAEEEGIATLRAELVRRGLELVRAATPDEASVAALAGMDAKFLLSLVQSHERNQGKAPGDIIPQRSDAGEATARLAKLLVRLKAERKQELALKARLKRAKAGL